LQVVVFHERECSIQRRNQKVVEESPSVLLTHETRMKMVEQVKRLCQKVGYVSAGTIEWLVDENQNFYFLEMNTRLQVEHPITEAISGIDLVKGMLWVGAGWGLPPELQIEGTLFPAKGHAIEARIYAEDPLRGYLPSTGPLVKYKEPAYATEDSYIRMDSGVVEGHVVSPFYDPMLSKIISYAPTRQEALDVLADALDEYVIDGVQHNARLVNAVLRHPSFQAGDTPTSFLQKHMHEFSGVQLTDRQEEELAVAVALIGFRRESYLQRPPIAGAFSMPLVVRLGGMFGSAFSVSWDDGKTAATVKKLQSEKESETVDGEERKILIDSVNYDLDGYLAHVSLDGVERAIQVRKISSLQLIYYSFRACLMIAYCVSTLQVLTEEVSGEMKMQMYGADMPCLIQSPREYELSKHMHPPKIVDTSDIVMSPMPGTLINFSVSEGDRVEIGQELCIVEAMKMQNIVRSPRAGIVTKFNKQAGSTLVTDEVIMEFGEETEDEAA
jgi:propionyl-CoA carboxylase alpha chain